MRIEEINGVDVDSQTRCAHYHSALDVIAIKFKCCGKWFSCFECHIAMADHPAAVWPRNERNAAAVLCGACGCQLTIADYLTCDSTCPKCGADFNPGCANHYHLYFS